MTNFSRIREFRDAHPSNSISKVWTNMLESNNGYDFIIYYPEDFFEEARARISAGWADDQDASEFNGFFFFVDLDAETVCDICEKEKASMMLDEGIWICVKCEEKIEEREHDSYH